MVEQDLDFHARLRSFVHRCDDVVDAAAEDEADNPELFMRTSNYLSSPWRLRRIASAPGPV